MGLSYYYTFSAPAEKTAGELELFLRSVEREARGLGFAPTLVLNAKFDNQERRDFARRLTTGLRLESEKLKGTVLLADGQVWSHDPTNGSCRVIPKQAVLLVVTNEQGHESVFGFLRYPDTLKEVRGRDVVKTGTCDRWTFHDFVNSPDSRYRAIVKQFVQAGYVEMENDEFLPRKEEPGFVPASLREAAHQLRMGLKRPVAALSKGEFIRVWSSIAYLFPGLHPDGFDEPQSGWPRVLKRFAVEAWRRLEEAELQDAELYSSDAQWAGIYDRMSEHTEEEIIRRREIACTSREQQRKAKDDYQWRLEMD